MKAASIQARARPLRGNVPLRDLAWPEDRLGEALESLAWRSGLAERSTGMATAGPGDLPALAAWLGLEAEAVAAPYAGVEALVARCAPAILRVPAGDGDPPAFLALLRSGRRATLLTPDGRLHGLSPAPICGALRAPLEHGHAAAAEQLLARSGVPAARWARARRILIAEQLGPATVEAGWILRPAPAAGIRKGARELRLGRSLARTVALILAVQVLALAAWWALGRDALDGSLGWFWLQLWALLLLTALPLQLLQGLAQADMQARGSALLRQRLLQGALALSPDTVRSQGIGHVLSHASDIEAFDDTLAVAALGALAALVQLGAAGAALAFGAAPPPHLALLALALVAVVGLAALLLRASLAGLTATRALTNDLVERIAGHRTRRVQEHPAARHREEDRLVASASAATARADTVDAVLASLPRLWAVCGLLALSPVLLGGARSPAVALSLAGVLLATQALAAMVAAAPALVAALGAYRQLRPYLAVPPDDTPPAAPAPPDHPAEGQPLLLARGLSFRYGARREPVLRGFDLQVRHGDQVLLQGASGSGKSTLAALLAGLRAPESGLLLLHGLDRASLGAAGWRRRVAAAPQFHENHIFAGTLAFNLLLGRRWPPRPEDLADAAALCRELGLGPLLDRMPAGLMQIVGETGWQLSHGERSRVFLARALLQGAHLVILDESFGALDPETLDEALDCALRRAPTLIAIVHT